MAKLASVSIYKGVSMTMDDAKKLGFSFYRHCDAELTYEVLLNGRVVDNQRVDPGTTTIEVSLLEVMEINGKKDVSTIRVTDITFEPCR